MSGLLWVYIAEVIVIMVLTFLMIYRYMRKGAPIYVYFTVYVGWILGFVILATLPFDIYTSSVYDAQNPTEAMEFFRGLIQWNWKILYILTFILTWLVFPFLMAYVIRGEFSRLRKI